VCARAVETVEPGRRTVPIDAWCGEIFDYFLAAGDDDDEDARR
jgi:hypothetical protein